MAGALRSEARCVQKQKGRNWEWQAAARFSSHLSEAGVWVMGVGSVGVVIRTLERGRWDG